MNLTTVDTSCKWEHTVFVLLCLSPSYSFMLSHVTEFPTLWRLNIFHCMYMHYIFFVHSSVYVWLGQFQTLGIMSNAAMNTGMQIFLSCTFSSFGQIRRSGTAGSYGSSIFNYLKIFHFSWILNQAAFLFLSLLSYFLL
jgi:hypothetical protein